MSRINMRLALATIVSAAALGVFGAATPAQATDDDYYTLVLHDDAGYEGWRRVLQKLVWHPELGAEGMWVVTPTSEPDLGGFSDKTSSLVNNDWMAWVVYDDKNYRDRHYCIRPGETVPNLSSSRWKFNDKISSAWRLNTASCAGYPAFYSTS
ncbi:hypothetical protein IMZ11_15920 [Microtetraspora sp. AC03309]|uniref:beta/gamma crystallin family protein n=1 Tax=Microtetraspora sp. AC03309 TaxID=2779376 RepID=UPI001E488E23|nr:beta/gamma crystallin family protein [Microtetraspora sp. AC03309]MCC5577113.1 hypothetical protein [Microtetraspora sp. AC03309]